MPALSISGATYASADIGGLVGLAGYQLRQAGVKQHQDVSTATKKFQTSEDGELDLQLSPEPE